MDAVIYSVVFATIAFVTFLILKGFDKRLTFALGLLFAAYIGLNDLVSGLPTEVSALRPFPTRWNWWGNTYSVLLSVVVILGLRLNREAVGLVLPARNIKVGLIALVLVVLPSPIVGLIVDLDPPSATTLAFQGLMPGLAEEIAYRGIAPALLLGLMHDRRPEKSIPWAVIFIAAIPFGVVHGMGYNDGTFSFSIGPMLHTLIGGIIYTWMRFQTGSLLFPILAHSLGNLTYALAGFI
jgi:membrane protease YdiL (CAAX protease family)